jgi:cobalt-zinc-cadmium efflux system outer membrane protein
MLDRLWQAGELNTTDYLVQLKQALGTEASAIDQRGRMWQAWATWLAASGQADQWLNLAGETR